MVKIWKILLISSIIAGATIASVIGISSARAQENKNDIGSVLNILTALPFYLEVRIVANGDWEGTVNLGGTVTPVSGSTGIFAYGGFVLHASCSITNTDGALLWVGINVNGSILNDPAVVGENLCLKNSVTLDEVLECFVFAPNTLSFIVLFFLASQ